MSLKVWNSPSDPYDHEQLADNFLKLDIHDHSQGRGAQIGAAGIQNGAITNLHIAQGLKMLSPNLGPTVGSVSATASLTATTTPTDVAGATVTLTPSVASTLVVNAAVSFFITPAVASTTTAFARLMVDGVAQPRLASKYFTVAAGGYGVGGTSYQTWAIPLTAAAHTIKLQGYYTTSAGTPVVTIGTGDTGFTYALWAS